MDHATDLDDVVNVLNSILDKLVEIHGHLELIASSTSALEENSNDHRLGKPPYSSMASRR